MKISKKLTLNCSTSFFPSLFLHPLSQFPSLSLLSIGASLSLFLFLPPFSLTLSLLSISLPPFSLFLPPSLYFSSRLSISLHLSSLNLSSLFPFLSPSLYSPPSLFAQFVFVFLSPLLSQSQQQPLFKQYCIYSSIFLRSKLLPPLRI